MVYFGAPANPEAEIELTYNWPATDGAPAEDYGSARNFGHLAFQVDDIYALCAHLQSLGVVINRPPRDGRMAFVRHAGPDFHRAAAERRAFAAAGAVAVDAQHRQLVIVFSSKRQAT